ncbi:MAG TPA: hypothetical protein VN903_31640 [Polyangia bacterium]|nr:hypothetical protein [Polyangia bacterium]HXU05569.1 hypothetical protein [Polyangia bacterium]
MPTNAGEMTQTPPGDPQWVASDGKYHHGYVNQPNPARPHTGVSTGTRRDFRRRNGWLGSRGIGGWMVRVPRDPAGTWFISLADDSSETTLVNPPTAMKPPAGVR